MSTTDLKLDHPGSLLRPGPVGRIVRLGYGAASLWYVSSLIQIFGNLTETDGQIRPVVWNGIIFGLFLVSYVVNIGYSRDWKKWPAVASAVALLFIAGISYAMSGTIETNLMARSIWVWELYIFSHLGLAFIIGGVIGTPGCEMRAFHDLYSRLTGVVTQEHSCPVGPLHSIDQWEANKKRQRH